MLCKSMTRDHAIAIINETLPSLDDEQVQAVADIAKSMAADDGLPRELTPRELALTEQSKEDFKAGRTYTLDEMDAYLDAVVAERKLACAK